MTKISRSSEMRSPLVTRSYVEPTKDYLEYVEHLRHDFFYSCAYCTITEHEAETINFNIDHYEPKSLRPDLTNEYSNLMYACRFCNTYKATSRHLLRQEKPGLGFFGPIRMYMRIILKSKTDALNTRAQLEIFRLIS
jgi:5-methylcytosine-specific restriction endonuclease McrA